MESTNLVLQAFLACSNGDFEAAMTITGNIPDRYQRDQVFDAIAVGLAAQGKFAEASVAADCIRIDSVRNLVLGEVAFEQHFTDPEGAFQTVKKISETVAKPVWHKQLLRRIEERMLADTNLSMMLGYNRSLRRRVMDRELRATPQTAPRVLTLMR